ncbi:MAG: ferredoxin [Pseudomonadota bacterium]
MTENSNRQYLPTFPTVVKDSENSQKLMHALRHFHLGNPRICEQLEPLDKSFLPAMLGAYRDTSQLRYDYPLYLSSKIPVSDGNNNINNTNKESDLAQSISLYLKETIESFARTPDSARILKDNLAWIERSLRVSTKKTEGPTLLVPLLSQSCEELLQHLQLDKENQQRLLLDIKQLLAAIPKEALILGYGRFPALHLLMHLITHQVIPKLSQFKTDSQQYIKQLSVLLAVDDSKQSQASSAAALKSNIGSKQFFNTESLSKIVKHSQGSINMSLRRRKRIEDALAVLQAFKEKQTLIHIVHSHEMANEDFINKNVSFTNEHHSDPCLKATEVFDQQAQELAQVFAAARIAKLEIANSYNENIHDPWFNSFSWEAFSSAELILVPSVIVLESANRLANESMVSFSQLLNSGRPVHIFARVQAHNNPGAKENEDPFKSYRSELGYFGISHRQAVVTQCSAARHQHLLKHYTTALNATRTSLHLISVGLREVAEGCTQEQELGLNAWLVAGAALEGRAHPFFMVNPAQGDSAADRMDFAGNPQPEKDWPSQIFNFIAEGGESSEMQLSFTFADYALLTPRLYHHFTLISPQCESDDLLVVADYLSLPEEQVDHLVPYILAVNKHNELYKLAVSRALIHACRDRLNFWHTLQEMAGVSSRYLEQAELRIQSEADNQIAIKLGLAEAQFKAELERVKTQAAAEVMSRLTDILLGMDLSSTNSSYQSLPASAADPTSLTASTTADPAEKKQQQAAEEPQQESFDDAWIDSPLCTTCNDCTDMNPLMFVYNDTNQAIIADLGAGTYKQMVEAAEICPSKCIHPGKPWDKSEDNLDDLTERAVAFN